MRESRVCGAQLMQQVADMLISEPHQCHHKSDWNFGCGCEAATGGRGLSWEPCNVAWQAQSLNLWSFQYEEWRENFSMSCRFHPNISLMINTTRHFWDESDLNPTNTDVSATAWKKQNHKLYENTKTVTFAKKKKKEEIECVCKRLIAPQESKWCVVLRLSSRWC